MFDRLLALGFLACSVIVAARPARELAGELRDLRASRAEQRRRLEELAGYDAGVVERNIAAFQRELSELEHNGWRLPPPPTGFVFHPTS